MTHALLRAADAQRGGKNMGWERHREREDAAEERAKARLTSANVPEEGERSVCWRLAGGSA